MIDPAQMMDLADAEAIGARLIALLKGLEALDRITPGMTADWGLEVGGHVFAFTIKVRRDIEVPA